MADRYAVLGNPIKHSQSPRIHQQFAAQTEQSISYEALEAPLDDFEGFVGQLGEQGYRGMNVTVPFKEQAWRLCTHRSERAEHAGAVNTLIREGDGSGWRGDNTDGIGLLNDLQENAGVDLGGKRILLLGAGGAVRGVLLPLLDANPASLHIANRTASKAEALAKDFANRGQLSGSGYDFAVDAPFDVIINGTAASLSGDVPPVPDGAVSPDTLCYDMMYSATPTAFMRWAERHGAASRDGLGMLVEQAAESFYLWRGVRPETGSVLKNMREIIGRG